VLDGDILELPGIVQLHQVNGLLDVLYFFVVALADGFITQAELLDGLLLGGVVL